MQYIALDATTIILGEEENRLVADAGLSHGTDQTQPECVFRARLYHRMMAQDRDFRGLEPIEDDLADDDYETGLTGWKRLATWTGATVASWGVVAGGVAIARALLSRL